MRRHHIRIVCWLIVSAAWHTACKATVDHFPPDLIFFGTVRTAAGAGVRATVEIQQRYGCNSSKILITHSTQSSDDGSYELREELEDLGWCFVAFASSADGSLVSDTIRIPGSELDELGDPLGTGRIPLDIEVR